jgi:hypothetical protein
MDDTPVTWSWTDVMIKYYNEGKNKFDQANEDKNVLFKSTSAEVIDSWWEKIQFMCKYLNGKDYPHKIIFEDTLELNIDNLNARCTRILII